MNPPCALKFSVCAEALIRHVRQTDRRAAGDACEDEHAKRDEQDDGHDLDHDEPVLDGAELTDLAGVHVDERDGEHEHP